MRETHWIRVLFWILGLFILASGLAVVLGANRSYVLINWYPYRVQITLNFFVLLLVVSFVGMYCLSRLVSRALKLPAQVRAYRQERLRQQSQFALREAATLFLGGRYGQAFRQAKEAFGGESAQGLSALLAAKAAHALREPVRRDEWLKKTAEYDKDVRVARLMAEAEFAIADREFDQASACLEQIFASGQRHIAALKLALQVEQARGRWNEMTRLARQLRKHNALTQEQAAPLLRKAMLEQLRDAAEDLPELRRVWKSLPDEERLDPAFLIRAVPYLIHAGDTNLAAEALSEALKKDWDTELAILYGRCKTSDLREQLATAEGWLKEHPDDEGLLLTLGRLCLQAQLWGKAQSYFEASLSQAPSRATHLELAKLAERLERNNEAQKHYRAAAELYSGSPAN